MSFAYDLDGNQTQVIDSFGGTQTSVYDADHRLTSRSYVGQGQVLLVNFTYNPQGLVSSETRYDSVSATSTYLIATTATTYDLDGQVLSILSTNAASAASTSSATPTTWPTMS